MKLVKLDFEKTRLLIWANQIGLASTDPHSRRPGIEGNEADLRAILEQIQSLMAEANKVQDRYGVCRAEALIEDDDMSTDLISRNSLATFMSSYRRFRGRFSEHIPKPKLGTRVRWAIFDENRFEILIKTLRDFVDNLFWLVEVNRTVQDRIVGEDIMAVTSIEDLEMIRDASEDDHQVWSEVASHTVERTERDTTTHTDMRNQEMYDKENDLSWDSPSPTEGQPTGESFSQRSCDRDTLQLFRLKRTIGDEISNHALATVYIYVAPCDRLLSQAFGIHWETATSAFFDTTIRVDDRLSVTCCEPSMSYGRLVSLLNNVRHDGIGSYWSRLIDQTWLEQRIYDIQEGKAQTELGSSHMDTLPFVYQTDNYEHLETVGAIILLGEEKQLRKIMSSRSFPQHPRVPSASEIYAIHPSDSHYGMFTRRYMGTFVPNPELYKRKDLDLTIPPEDALPGLGPASSLAMPVLSKPNFDTLENSDAESLKEIASIGGGIHMPQENQNTQAPGSPPHAFPIRLQPPKLTSHQAIESSRKNIHTIDTLLEPIGTPSV
ncbi:MAG: hypothetical protein L6R41_003771 [Letrouitia leprolyta]|nr:MAG: hypothetical protein L6R41_003771 [Letrouitia leprolyta]